jgi:hypothetical protein
MKLLAPKWQMMSDPQLTGYFANFMVEVSREHTADEGLPVGVPPGRRPGGEKTSTEVEA